MVQRWLAATVVWTCVLSSVLLARQGTVVTKDNNSFDGDITEDQANGSVTVVTHGITYTHKMANVQSIIYVDEVDRDVRNQVAALPANDVKGRLSLAEYALSHHALATANDVLVRAQKIEPDNPAVRDLLERVKAQIRAQQPAAPHLVAPAAPVVIATQPTTAPAAAGARPQTPAPPEAPTAGAATRDVTADELNQVRQSELRDGDNVRVKLDSDVRRRFADYISMSPTEFNKLPAMQQAFMILDKGKSDMRRDVKILSDPPAMASFRKNVERTLIAGCAASKCHGGAVVPMFRLSLRETESGAYTNFLAMQQYSTHIHGRQVLMINRQNPEQSLLLEYLLPPGITDDPHPEAKAYHGAVRNKTDPRFAAVFAWIRDDLKPVTPDYSRIDLSKPPATQPAAGNP